MPVLTEEEAKARTEKSDDRISFILRDKKHSSAGRGKHGEQGRTVGATNLNDFARELIGTAAHFDKRKNVVEEFGVSGSSVSSFKRGRISVEQTETGQVLEKVSNDVKRGIRKRLDDITEKATERIIKVLDQITDARIETVDKVTELTVIAKNLSSVVEKANPKDSAPANAVQVNLYVPGQSREADFESIPVVYHPLEER